MSKTRASIFESDADEVDVSTFTPKPGPDRAAPPPAAVRAVAEAANFRSREATHVPPPPTERRPLRRHRTGRNVQFNLKASQETVDAFYAISDQQGWVLGETLEYAVAALQREMAAKGQGSAT